MTRYSLFDALAPMWHAPLTRLGMPDQPTPEQVAIWQASRRASHRQYAVPVEAVQRRASGQPTASIADELDLQHSTLRHGLDLAALRLLTPWMSDVPAWRVGRDDAHPDHEIADLYGVPEYLVRIALDGWPETGPTPGSIQDDALRLWREGAELADIAAHVHVRPDRLRQWVREGSLRLSPARLTPREVSRRFGWSHSLNLKYRLAGVLPAPDGGTHSDPWWWPDTIAKLAAPRYGTAAHTAVRGWTAPRAERCTRPRSTARPEPGAQTVGTAARCGDRHRLVCLR